MISARQSLSHTLARAFGSAVTADHDEISPEGLYEQAMRLQREGRLETALGAYSQVIMADPEFAEAYYGRACVCYMLGNCDQAINDCNQALELRRDFIDAYLIRGAAFWGK